MKNARPEFQKEFKVDYANAIAGFAKTIQKFPLKKILYRSEHRGTKEMDLLLSNFVRKYVNFLIQF